MKNVSILVPESSVIQAIADPCYVFNTVNQFLQSKGQSPLFRVQLVGQTREIKLNNGLFLVHPDKLLETSGTSDLVFIPALFGDMSTAIAQNQAVIPWIREQYEHGATVASLCVGAFLLASTGLLNGKHCSTHWAFSNEFRKMFPEVHLTDGNIITEEGRLYSSGGANSYWNLLLYLVEKYTDRETTIMASKFFTIEIDRNNQSTFMMFSGQKKHADHAIIRAQEYIEANYQSKIMVDQLADQLVIGRRTFERRFKHATNNTVVEYQQRVRIEAAKRSFESSRNNISEVMLHVGYTDSKAFRDIFKKITGLTPLDYKNKYCKT
jgi:transcriptional regulator GlxA family with amidase domain